MTAYRPLYRVPPPGVRRRPGRIAPHRQRERRFASRRRRAPRGRWMVDAVQTIGAGDRAGRNGRPSAGRTPSRRRCRASRSRWCTATTTCSRPTRSTSGSRRRSSRRFATATSTPAARPTTRARCSRTSKASRPGSSPVSQLPLQVKFLIEGEEEVGSANLEPFVAANRERLACDCVVISDCCQFGPGVPAITYGLRGIAYLRAASSPARGRICTPARSAAASPIRPVRWSRCSPRSRTTTAASKCPASTTTWCRSPTPSANSSATCRSTRPRTCRQLGVDGTWGEAGYTTLERRWARPTCDINGLTSGYQGEGAKTVLPARASAKFSFRLVPNQDPAKIDQVASREFLAARVPPGIRMELVDFHGAPGVVVPLESPYIRGRRRRDRGRLRHRRPSTSAKAARSRSSTPSPASSAPTCSCWAGAKTTTTPTAPTKSSPSPTSNAASAPAPTFGKNLPNSPPKNLLLHPNLTPAPPLLPCSTGDSFSKDPTWSSRTATAAA